MSDLQLFRIQIFLPDQRSFFEHSDFEHSAQGKENVTRLLELMMEESKNVSVKRWHLGDITRLDDHGFYFRFGREREMPDVGYEGGRFVEKPPRITVPYTHVVIDSDLEVIAIASESDLAAKARTAANLIKRSLQTSQTASNYGLTLSIKPIFDPSELVELIGFATVARRFRVDLARPNAFDVNKDFVQPCQLAVEFLEGDRGRADVSGKSLNRAKLQEVTRSAASTGSKPSVWLRMPNEKRAKKRGLVGNPVVVSKELPSDSAGWLGVLKSVRAAYDRVRRG